MQETSFTPHGWPQLAYTAVVLTLGVALKAIADYFIRRRKEPAEVAHLHAQSYNLRVRTDLDVIQELRAVIEKAETRREEWTRREEQLKGQRDFWRDRAEDAEHKLIQAEADAQTAIMFNEQLNAAAKLKGVKLSDYTPQQLNPKK